MSKRRWPCLGTPIILRYQLMLHGYNSRSIYFMKTNTGDNIRENIVFVCVRVLKDIKTTCAWETETGRSL